MESQQTKELQSSTALTENPTKNESKASRCIKFIKSLNFQSNTSLQIFCRRCTERIEVFAKRLDESETQIDEFLNKHKDHGGCSLRSGAEKWDLPTEDDQEIKSDELKSEEKPFTKIDEQRPKEFQPPIDSTIELNNFMEGAFIVSRSLFQSEVWFMPLIFLKAWLWMLGRANHKDVKEGDFIYHRGEFFTYYKEIQETLSYKPYQKHKRFIPSKQQVRDIIDWFVTSDMIEKTPIMKPISPKLPKSSQKQGVEKAEEGTHPKTKSRTYIGLKIRIINYDTYQSLENYKNIPKGEHKNIGVKIYKNTGRTQVEHYNNNDKEVKDKYVATSVEVQLAFFLFQEIQRNERELGLSPTKEPNIQEWARHIDRMIRIDKRTPERIREVIEWCQRDRFWQNNILSTRQLRDKFRTLEGQMVDQGKGKPAEKSMNLYEQALKEQAQRNAKKAAKENTAGKESNINPS